MPPQRPTRIAIASYLEPDLVASIAAVSDDVQVAYEPALLPPPRFAADHKGDPSFRRTPEQERRFRELLASCDVHYGFDPALASELVRVAPGLRWIQFTSSGIVARAKEAGLDASEVVVTNAAGVHAVPLAEHVLTSLLYFVKDLPARARDQRAHAWTPHANRELRGRTVVVVGLGAVGREIARLCRAVGMKVIGVRRRATDDPSAYHVDEAVTSARLSEVLPRADALVLICPLTPDTEGLIDADALARLPEGAVLVNVGRGALVDEPALIDALGSGHLAGAALDVTRVEPLPSDSPLWDLPNVLITPHSAAKVELENERLTELFCDNLRRWLDGQPLRNVVRL